MIRAKTPGPQLLGKGCGPEALGSGPRRGGWAHSAPRVPALHPHRIRHRPFPSYRGVTLTAPLTVVP